MYAGNVASKRVPFTASYKKYHKLKIQEKLEAFKKDWLSTSASLSSPEGEEHRVLGGDGILRYSVWDDVSEEDHIADPDRRYFTFEQGMDMACRNGVLHDHADIADLKAPNAMSYESFRNRETWLVNVWGYVEGLAELYMENEDPENVTGATPQWCRDCFDMLVEDTYKTLPNGILRLR